jgi:hypothetical protein
VIQHFGNPAAKVTVDQVATLRVGEHVGLGVVEDGG